MHRRAAPTLVALVALAACGRGADGAADRAPADAAAPSDASDASAPTDAGDAADAREAALPAGVDALLLPDASPTDDPIALYPLDAPRGGVRGVAYVLAGGTMTALDQDANVVWSEGVGDGALFGGFDFDADDWPDVGLARAAPNGGTCAGAATNDTWLDLARGRDGALFPKVVAPLADICWTFGYATAQWTVLGVMFGRTSHDLVLSPQYTSTNGNALDAYDGGAALVVGYADGGLATRGEMVMPTVPAYDAFAAARPEPHGSGTKYYAASHVPNGLFTGTTRPRLLFFTSGRVVTYDDAAPWALASDYPYLTGGRTDLVGRNYGLVEIDPVDATRTALVAGTGTWSLWLDMKSGAMITDPWGGIERHVSVHESTGNTIVDRFYSYAHDDSDGDKYEGRVAHAAATYLATAGVTPSRLVYSVYTGGHWHAVVTTPGGVDTAFDRADAVVWDVRDLDGDGVVEVLESPARDPTDPDVPGYYFTKWRTEIAHWDEASRALVTTRTIEGGIPWLVASFRAPTRTTSDGTLWPAAVVATPSGARLVLRGPDGTRSLVSAAP